MRSRKLDRQDVNVPVLVFSDSLLVLHHGNVGIIRTFGRMGVPVYTVVKDRFTPAAASRYLTAAFVRETCGLDSRRLLEEMSTIGERLNRPTIVIPIDDVAAIFIAEQAATLKRWTSEQKRIVSVMQEDRRPMPQIRFSEFHRGPRGVRQVCGVPSGGEGRRIVDAPTWRIHYVDRTHA